MGTLRRRALLAAAGGVVVLAGAGTAGVATDVLPGSSRVRRALGFGEVRAEVPAAGAGDPVYATFTSAARGRDVTWGHAVPPGHAAQGLPVALFLHGRGDDAHATFTHLGAHQYLAAHVAAGGTPFALVTVDGGQTYWHPRADGDDPLAMLRTELWPRVADAGFDVSRWGVGGWSMGAFGALLLAREVAAGRFAVGGELRAATASSPALFASAGATSAGSFDDAADWRRYGDLVSAPGTGGVGLSVSCGSEDPFLGQTEAYRAACAPTPAGGISSGRHDVPYWRSRLPEQFAFLGQRLAG